jgi:hypothetical protein
MPLIVSETTNIRDPNHSTLTQSLLSPEASHLNDEDEEANLKEALMKERKFGTDEGNQSPPQLSFHSEGQSHSCRQNAFPQNIPGPVERQTVALELQNIKPTPNPECQAKTLSWLTCPVTTAEEDAPLPSISVFSEPEVTDELQLIVHSNGEGTAQVSGKRFVSLRSQGSLRPSVASFDDIRIKRAGLYVIEVRAVRNTELSLVADHPTDIVAKINSHNSLSEGNLPDDCGLGAAIWNADYS